MSLSVLSIDRSVAALDPERAPRGLVYAALALLALLLRLASGTGSIGSDDLVYADYARALAEGRFAERLEELRPVEQLHYALRFGLLVPMAAIYRLLGVSELTTTILPLLASIASLILLAEVGRRMFGLRVGVIAALLYATFPIQLIIGTVLLPEAIAECYILSGVLCYLHARDRGRGLWFISGLFMGTAYLTKEPALFVAGGFLVHALWERRWQGAALFAAGVAAIGAAEHAYYFLQHGDVLFRPHSTQLYTIPAGVDFFTPVRRNLGHRLFVRYPEMMLIPSLKFGIHSLVAIGLAFAVLATKPPRGTGMVLVWLVIPGLFLNFGSWSISVYAPLPTDERYIELLYPPLFLLSGIAWSRALGATRETARSATVGLGLVLIIGMTCGLAVRQTVAYTPRINVLRELVREVSRVPGQTIFTDELRWRRALGLFDASILSDDRETATFILGSDPLRLPALRRPGQAADDDGPFPGNTPRRK